MSFNVPDSFPKLLVLIGIIGIAVGIYTEKELTENYYLKYDKFDEIQDEVILESYIVGLKRENLIKRSQQLSERYNTENPIVDEDSTITFHQTFSGDKIKVLISDSLNFYWNDYVKKKASLDILNKRKEIKLKNIESEEKLLNSRLDFYRVFSIIGIISLFLGLATWVIESPHVPEKIIKQSDKIYKYCQSCGHNFTSVRLYGTEKDKTKNLAFCIACYEKGKFTEANLSNEDFIKRKKEEIKNFNLLTRRLLLRRFKNLERWNKDKYF